MNTFRTMATVVGALGAMGPSIAVNGQEQAPLFDSVDENMNPVSMADMIDGRPLILAMGSCT